MKSVWRTKGRLLASSLLVVFLLLPGRPAAAREAHWAAVSAKTLADLGIGDGGLAAVQAAGPEQPLDEPITPLEWQRWVRQTLARALGEEWISRGDTDYWIDAYTAPLLDGPRSVITRGFVVAGLMKLGNMAGFVPSGGEGPPVLLPLYRDWRDVEEMGFGPMWELMLQAGIVDGYPDGTLRPHMPLTKAEAACLLKGWLDGYRAKTPAALGQAECAGQTSLPEEA